MRKYMLLIGAADGRAPTEFKKEYLRGKAAALAHDPSVLHLTTNLIEDPTPEMIDAGWGWGGRDDSGILLIDELWTEDETDVLSLYKDQNVIGAYEVNEIRLRDCSPDWPMGTASHWVKRMGLLKCFDGQRPEDFHAYWQYIHAPKALQHHIGAGKYWQNHFVRTVKEAPVTWNGSMSLYYWNVDAFRFGHFSRPDSRSVIAEDGSHFMDRFLALYAVEYIMK